MTSSSLEVPVRRGHSEWFSAYYGESVEGDDAAVYETSKQLILRNISDADIFIKTFQQNQKTFLVLVTEQSAVADTWVELQKVYDTPLQVRIIKQIYKKSRSQELSSKKFYAWFPLFVQFPSISEKISSLSSEQFISRYLKVNRELR